MNILGIHDGHNCGATLVKKGVIVASVCEERLSRNKNEVGYLNKLLSHLTRNVIEVAPAQYSLNKHKSLPDNSSGMFFAPSLLLLGGINDDEEELWEKWVKCLRKIMEQESVENIGIKSIPINNPLPLILLI